VLERERGEVCVRRQVAGGAERLEQLLEQDGMTRTGRSTVAQGRCWRQTASLAELELAKRLLILEPRGELECLVEVDPGPEP